MKTQHPIPTTIKELQDKEKIVKMSGELRGRSPVEQLRDRMEYLTALQNQLQRELRALEKEEKKEEEVADHELKKREVEEVHGPVPDEQREWREARTQEMEKMVGSDAEENWRNK